MEPVPRLPLRIRLGAKALKLDLILAREGSPCTLRNKHIEYCKAFPLVHFKSAGAGQEDTTAVREQKEPSLRVRGGGGFKMLQLGPH